MTAAAPAAIRIEHRRITAQCQLCGGSCQTQPVSERDVAAARWPAGLLILAASL
jgi:hypothetical protein